MNYFRAPWSKSLIVASTFATLVCVRCGCAAWLRYVLLPGTRPGVPGGDVGGGLRPRRRVAEQTDLKTSLNDVLREFEIGS